MSQDHSVNQKKYINCRGRLLSLDKPRIMGVLNVTPDSFYDGGKFNALDVAVTHAEKMLSEGADIIDIGGISTRPGSVAVSVEDELLRVMPVVQKLREKFPEAILSIDTYRAEVAQTAVESGVDIVNDVSGGTLDEKMIETVSRLKVPYVLNHIQGAPQNMQDDPSYENVLTDVALFFSKQVNRLKVEGVADIILDPGYGFGKSVSHNLQLLKHQSIFRKVLELPVLAGLSRKSIIRKVTGAVPEDALPGTIALHTLALTNGASILRVHDVQETVQVVKLLERYHSIQ